MVLVSVLMGSYNYERYIGEAIESVLNQSFKDLELIIVDDCSTDNSRHIIESYQKQDPRIRTQFHEKNLGIARTGNDGLKMASGEYVSFIGSDDVWVPSKLEKQLSILRGNQDKIIWSEGEVIDSKGASTGRTISQLLNSPKKKNGNMFDELLRENYIFGQSLLFKTEYAKDIALNEDFRYVNDHLFFVELSRNHEFVFIPEPLAKYRMHGSNITMKNEDIWFKERILLRKYFLEKYAEEISVASRADIYHKIGHALSGLGKKEIAKKYYFKAARTDPFCANSILYLILALTDGEGFKGKFLTDYYYRVSSLLTTINGYR